jgi:EF hand
MKVIGTSMILSLCAVAANAQLPPIASIDSNGDGVVSRAEWLSAREQAAAARFDELDADGDGSLVPDELRAHGRGRMDRFRARAESIDTDSDGAWSLAELQAVWPQISVERFNRMDTNGNGLIEEDERPPQRRRATQGHPL